MNQHQIRARDGRGTALEKNVRDTLLWPITRLIRRVPYGANVITCIGFAALIAAAVDFFLTQSTYRQVWYIASAWITDFIDGPDARNNGRVTALGTFLDLARDFCLELWMLFIGLYATYHASTASPLSAILYSVLSITVAGKLIVALGILLFFREKRLNRQTMAFRDSATRFFLKDLRITWIARCHTFFLGLGGTLYIGGWAMYPILICVGTILLVLQLPFLGAHLYEIFRLDEERYRAILHRMKRRLRMRHKIKKTKQEFLQ